MILGGKKEKVAFCNIGSEQMEKKENWVKPRHRIVRGVLAPFIKIYIYLCYGIRVEPFRQQGERAYLILMNHQTPLDQFFVAVAFRGPVYYIATEDLFSNGWVSSLIRWLVEPIPIKKQTSDLNAVRNCIRVAREGGTIAMAPEGNRTYSGKTEYMNPAVAGLARKLKLPIALLRIEGGYGVEPRWSSVVRKGKMRAYVSRVIEPEDYAGWSAEELYEKIRDGLYVDEAVADGLYRSNKRAEYLERAMYVCPFCGLAEFESHGNEAFCKRCGRKITYGEDKTITGIGYEFPFRFVKGWYEYQEKFINSLDVTTMTDAPVYTDRARMSEVIFNKRKALLRKDAQLSLYGDRIVIDEGTQDPWVFPFGEVSAVTVLGRNKLNIYHNKKAYQFKGSERFNALKYVHFYYRHKNITRNDANNTFLGI